jgi:hypothetical protein|nr:MAG TPA: hypothetical protein [Caudoviricetes sp.]DAN91579.1 MAG TPA: hypothetical protein [Caudoviricetes sp.]DAP36037.1 MAG TPA: hypothetical protein [Caudoviricetes sp.]DAS99632.1 MAG TPA: hypothetical protein [Caudoviricetes sp.]
MSKKVALLLQISYNLLRNYKKEMVKVATKSFTTEMTFDKKSVNSLIKALNNEKSPNRKPVKNVEIINNPDTIRKIFGKK